MVVQCLSLLLLAGKAWGAYGSSSSAGPIGSPTMPPSSYEGGLVANPNPIDTGGNSVITGNVRGGKQFRGPVPYSSSTSFRAPLGSTDLDSFMRYSAIPDELGGYSPGYETFYSPTGTVSKIRPGQGGVFAPTSPRVAGGIGQWRPDQPADVVDLGDIRQSHVSVGETASTLDAGLDSWRRFGYWPLSRMPEQTKQVVSDELGRQFTDDRASQQNDQPLTTEEYQKQIEQFHQQLERVKADASKLEQSLRTGEALPKDMAKAAPSDPAQAASSRTDIENLMNPLPRPPSLPADRRSDADLLPKPAPLTPDVSAIERQAQAPDAIDIQGLIAPPGLAPAVGAKGSATPESRPPSAGPQSTLGGLTLDAASRTNRIAELFLPKGQGGTGQSQPIAAGDPASLGRAKGMTGAVERPSISSTYVPPNVAAGTSSAPGRVASLRERLRLDEMDAMSGADANQPQTIAPKPPDRLADEQAQRKYETPTGASRERFDRYLKAAELYLQQGRYYRAAESFSLASLYNPTDSRVHLGRSQALFAAGEYVSSALFLAKAIELEPSRSLAKVDLVNATGGPDLFLRRITDLEQCAKTANAADLQLLLAYIYFEMDRPEEAKAAIDAAKKASPHTLAVDLLSAAVSK
jgi:hypothetical protein